MASRAGTTLKLLRDLLGVPDNQELLRTALRVKEQAQAFERIRSALDCHSRETADATVATVVKMQLDRQAMLLRRLKEARAPRVDCKLCSGKGWVFEGVRYMYRCQCTKR